MRTKHLNQMKIIECIIDNGVGMSFERIQSSCGIAGDIHVKTLHRALNELVDEKYLECNNGIYNLNKRKFPTNNNMADDVWKQLLNCAIESGEIECYRKIKDYIKPELRNIFFSDEALQRFKTTVIENVKILNDSKSKIDTIRYAIVEERELQLEYKGKTLQMLPLCIVVSRDGARNYLYGVRKKKLANPLELSDVNIIKIMDKSPVQNRDEYLNVVNGSWDIDIHDPIHVKVLLRKEYDPNQEIENQLMNYFETISFQDDARIIFEGNLVGINDFKKWVRENMMACCVIEPEQIRKEMIEALKTKISRYEIDG